MRGGGIAAFGFALVVLPNASCRTSVSVIGRETLYGLDFPDAALPTDATAIRDAPGDTSDAALDGSADDAEAEPDAAEPTDSAPGSGAGSYDAACVPKTCADFPLGTCGNLGDGCGGLTGICATCAAPEFCGGGGPYICGLGTLADDQ
jgi:hypothetical protein